MTLSPPDCASSAFASKGFFPPGYCSVVSSRWTYLLRFPGQLCSLSSTLNNAFRGITNTTLSGYYSGGILCRAPLRSIKIYANASALSFAPYLQLQIFDNNNGGALVATYSVPFFSNNLSNRQGYVFPVIPNMLNYEYKISNFGKPIPSSWVVVFSEPVIGNRWGPEYVTLTVVGQNCYRRTVSSQHDRRWLYTDVNNFLNPAVWGRGACSSKFRPDMPTVNCTKSFKPVTSGLVATSCPNSCPGGCANGYCDCGLGQCVCLPGYYGPTCSQSTCDGVVCGAHGRCVATYLGGSMAPTQSSCVCDPGWSGPTCDQNPCAGQTCSGRGYCEAVGDAGWKCTCTNSFYSGPTCNSTCAGVCPGSFPYGCQMSGNSDNNLQCSTSKFMLFYAHSSCNLSIVLLT